MRIVILAGFLASAAVAAVPGGALGQASPASEQADPAVTGSAALAQGRTRPPPSAGQSGGIYARPGRCRELAIGRKLSGLARQRFIKRCRVARRAMPRPVPGSPGPATVAPAPGAPASATPAPGGTPPKPPGQP